MTRTFLFHYCQTFPTELAAPLLDILSALAFSNSSFELSFTLTVFSILSSHQSLTFTTSPTHLASIAESKSSTLTTFSQLTSVIKSPNINVPSDQSTVDLIPAAYAGEPPSTSTTNTPSNFFAGCISILFTNWSAATFKPMVGLTTLPYRIIRFTTRHTVFTGILNPIPADALEGE